MIKDLELNLTLPTFKPFIKLFCLPVVLFLADLDVVDFRLCFFPNRVRGLFEES